MIVLRNEYPPDSVCPVAADQSSLSTENAAITQSSLGRSFLVQPYRKWWDGELKENSAGLSPACLSAPGSLLLGPVKALRKATPLLPVCFRRVCEKRRRDVCDQPPHCPSPPLEQEPRCARVGACLMNAEAGQLLRCCRSFPPCTACVLAKFFMALALAPDLSQTCQQLQEGFYLFFYELSYRNFPRVAHKTGMAKCLLTFLWHVWNLDRFVRKRGAPRALI